MAYMLGLDASLKKSGYVIIRIEGPDTEVVDKGLLKTNPADGITVIRLLKQQRQIRKKMEEYNINVVGMEAPFFCGNETEKLFALNQFIQTVFLRRGAFVVAFPPSMLKKLAIPDMSAKDITKAYMIDAAKTALNMHGQRLAEDVADAFWAGWYGRRFYRLFVEKKIKESDLSVYEKKAFCEKHTYTRGAKKGSTDYKGIIYRENELFYDFKGIKERLVENFDKIVCPGKHKKT